MCGRFTQAISWPELYDLYDIVDAAGAAAAPPPAPRWNGAPTQEFVVCQRTADGVRELPMVDWGFTPQWSAKPLINARAETVGSKSTFRTAFQQHRCLVPANGWFEWKTDEAGAKQPWWITVADGRQFSFAGIAALHGNRLQFSIVTCAASKSLRHIHGRQPAIIARADYDRWLGAGTSEGELQELINRPPEEGYAFYRVDRAANNVRNNESSVIDPAAIGPNLPGLFGTT